MAILNGITVCSQDVLVLELPSPVVPTNIDVLLLCDPIVHCAQNTVSQVSQNNSSYKNNNLNNIKEYVSSIFLEKV